MDDKNSLLMPLRVLKEQHHPVLAVESRLLLQDLFYACDFRDFPVDKLTFMYVGQIAAKYGVSQKRMLSACQQLSDLGFVYCHFNKKQKTIAVLFKTKLNTEAYFLEEIQKDEADVDAECLWHKQDGIHKAYRIKISIVEATEIEENCGQIHGRQTKSEGARRNCNEQYFDGLTFGALAMGETGAGDSRAAVLRAQNRDGAGDKTGAVASRTGTWDEWAAMRPGRCAAAAGEKTAVNDKLGEMEKNEPTQKPPEVHSGSLFGDMDSGAKAYGEPVGPFKKRKKDNRPERKILDDAQKAKLDELIAAYPETEMHSIPFQMHTAYIRILSKFNPLHEDILGVLRQWKEFNKNRDKRYVRSMAMFLSESGEFDGLYKKYLVEKQKRIDDAKYSSIIRAQMETYNTPLPEGERLTPENILAQCKGDTAKAAMMCFDKDGNTDMRATFSKMMKASGILVEDLLKKAHEEYTADEN